MTTIADLPAVLAAHTEWLATRGAKGARANLAGANLTRANLTGSDLARADLTGANLTGAKS